MPATINQSSIVRTSVGNKFRMTGTLAFTTYDTGGPAIQANQLSLDQIEWFELENQGGYIWDPLIATNQGSVNLKGYITGTGTSSITPVVNEAVTVAANTGTLASIPSIVQNVTVTAGGVTGPFLILTSGAPASGQVTITQATGVLTFNAADAVTAAQVTYITRVTGAGAGGASEIANGTNLAGLGNIPFECTGI